ncbi:hypothetical protein [Mycobacteroides abscessus]|uniref:hypothetical protein n=1 Tax=Mycobacteroides abscessus TaxID=36809 RepID=UPI00034CDB82|nr:hypothetical protein [Mycobacteroides abscessus]MBN7451766.1 hypothetical protein [Mycobacteroides abscessus subsp. abscessus]OLT88529.1 hypothetical protein BKG58_08770 [Mycobacteroides abscessus subsp. abscessus]PVB42502.1 hypothetical protein DDJ39_04925 [Mycobacteroides abscessus]CPR87430.1 Uncharacterised protein [Mycobacteroides abscessus]CPS57341.1 Uncharacterised protein [Mycobacteroides abscessus]
MSKYRTYINGHRTEHDQRIPDTDTLHEAVTQIVGWADETGAEIVGVSGQKFTLLQEGEGPHDLSDYELSIRKMPTYRRMTAADLDRVYGKAVAK